MIAFAKEVSSGGAEPEAALAEDHAGAGGLGGPRPLVVLQLGQVGGVAVRDELEEIFMTINSQHELSDGQQRILYVCVCSVYLTLVLHFLRGPPHYVDM